MLFIKNIMQLLNRFILCLIYEIKKNLEIEKYFIIIFKI